jgi:tetratricopeptide (TPR) repeat protein
MSRAWVLALLLVACPGERRPEARALEHFEAGRDLLERGDHQAALERFRQAREADPQRGLLRSWEAYALARGGEIQGAIELLEAANPATLSPHDRYNLAAWHARSGDRERALALLGAALEDEPELRDHAAEDPDFDGLREDGSLVATLEDRALRAVMTGEEGAILAGELYDLELEVQPASVELNLEWKRELPTAMRLQRVVDERSGPDDGSGMRSLRYRLRTHAGGEGSLGPWTLSGQGQRVEVPEQGWEALLPAGVDIQAPAYSPGVEAAWWTPREALAGLEAGTAELRHGRLVVCTQPGDRVDFEGAAPVGEALEIELREEGQTSLLAHAWPFAPDEQRFTVVITRQGSRLLEATVERPAD